jgi:hypothetical protein
LELAARAAARPPLPPPITRKSVSLEMGAMARDVCEKWRDIVLMRLAAGMDESSGRLASNERGCMEKGRVSAARQRGIAGWRGYIQSEWPEWASGQRDKSACREQRPSIATELQVRSRGRMRDSKFD